MRQVWDRLRDGTNNYNRNTAGTWHVHALLLCLHRWILPSSQHCCEACLSLSHQPLLDIHKHQSRPNKSCVLCNCSHQYLLRYSCVALLWNHSTITQSTPYPPIPTFAGRGHWKRLLTKNILLAKLNAVLCYSFVITFVTLRWPGDQDTTLAILELHPGPLSRVCNFRCVSCMENPCLDTSSVRYRHWVVTFTHSVIHHIYANRWDVRVLQSITGFQKLDDDDDTIGYDSVAEDCKAGKAVHMVTWRQRCESNPLNI